MEQGRLFALLSGALRGNHLLEGGKLAKAGKAAVTRNLFGIGVSLIHCKAKVLDGTVGVSGADASPGHVVVHGAPFLRGSGVFDARG